MRAYKQLEARLASEVEAISEDPELGYSKELIQSLEKFDASKMKYGGGVAKDFIADQLKKAKEYNSRIVPRASPIAREQEELDRAIARPENKDVRRILEHEKMCCKRFYDLREELDQVKEELKRLRGDSNEDTTWEKAARKLIAATILRKPFLSRWKETSFAERLDGPNNLLGLDTKDKQTEWLAAKKERLLAMFSNCRTMIKRAVRSSFCSAYNLSEKDLPDMAAERAKAIMAALDVTTEKEALSKFEDFVTGDDCTFPPGVNKDELSRFSLAWLIIVLQYFASGEDPISEGHSLLLRISSLAEELRTKN